MTKESIIKAWKFGHTKEYLFSHHYDDIKSKPEYKNLKASQKKHIAQNEVERILLENYKREVSE